MSINLETKTEPKADPKPKTEPEPTKAEPKAAPPKKSDVELALEDIYKDIIKDIPDWKEEDYEGFTLAQKVKVARKLIPKQTLVPAKNPAVPSAPVDEEPKFEPLAEKNKKYGKWYNDMIINRDGLRLRLNKNE